MKKFFSTFWYYATQKNEQNIWILKGFVLSYGLLSITCLMILVEMCKSEEGFLYYMPLAWIPGVFFIYAFSLFISMITRIQIMKEKRKVEIK